MIEWGYCWCCVFLLFFFYFILSLPSFPFFNHFFFYFLHLCFPSLSLICVILCIFAYCFHLLFSIPLFLFQCFPLLFPSYIFPFIFPHLFYLVYSSMFLPPPLLPPSLPFSIFFPPFPHIFVFPSFSLISVFPFSFFIWFLVTPLTFPPFSSSPLPFSPYFPLVFVTRPSYLCSVPLLYPLSLYLLPSLPFPLISPHLCSPHFPSHISSFPCSIFSSLSPFSSALFTTNFPLSLFPHFLVSALLSSLHHPLVSLFPLSPCYQLCYSVDMSAVWAVS